MEGYTRLILLCIMIVEVEAEYCGKLGDKEFYCEEGHCCGDFKCCTYYRYYEMWWFWLVWCVIIMLGCSCAYYRRSHIGPYTRLSTYWYSLVQPVSVDTTNNQPSATVNDIDNPTFKLPSYEEVIEMPQLGPPEDNEGAPPPYVCFTEEQSNNSCLQPLVETEVSQEDRPPEYSPAVAPQSNS